MQARVSAFDYADYRKFLWDAYQDRRKRNPRFSMSALVRRAGLLDGSRGYFALVCQGKRDLSPHTLHGFIRALDLKGTEATFFENMVHFNQARTPEERKYYYERLLAVAKGRKNRQIELLASQYSYYTKWYMVAVRELAALPGFREEPAWIAEALKGRISARQAADALKELEKLGLLARGADGRLHQGESCVKLTGGIARAFVDQFHVQMLEQAREALLKDDYSQRRASSLTFACPRDKFMRVVQLMDEFRDAMVQELTPVQGASEEVFQMNLQIFQLTETGIASAPAGGRKTAGNGPQSSPDSRQSQSQSEET